MRALAGEYIHSLCPAEIFRIEVPVHQNFCVLQNERAVKPLGCFHFHDAREVLPEIIHEFVLRRADDFLYRHSLDRAHGLADLRNERLFIEGNDNGREGVQRSREVDRFPVVDAALADNTLPRRPSFIGRENDAPVRDEVGADGGLLAVGIPLFLPGERAAVPPLAHRQREGVLPVLHKRRNVVFLHLQCLIVRRPAGRKIRIPHPYAVHFRKIHAQSRRTKRDLRRSVRSELPF